MNHEIEAYEGELKELRKSHDLLLGVFMEGKSNLLPQIKSHHEAMPSKAIEAFTWHKVQCNQCGVHSDLLQRNDGKTMCRQCYDDHFEESEE